MTRLDPDSPEGRRAAADLNAVLDDVEARLAREQAEAELAAS